MITETAPATSADVAEIFAGDYLNKLTGERIEYECRRRLDDGYRKILVNFSQTEIVNSIGISILLGVIDVAAKNGAEVAFTDVNEHTIELFDLLGLTKHVTIQ
ncbi:MAG: STAS domain-containing protein [Acidobacteria bacterium]|nr:STAS domain-containing protein [Acidobacteriota bacterium]